MIKRLAVQKTTRFYALVLLLLCTASCAPKQHDTSNQLSCSDRGYLTSISVRQTSGQYLHDYMKAIYEGGCFDEGDRERIRSKLALVTDVYIKSWSYAVLNKIFFFVSIFFALVVLIWPSISAVAPTKLGNKPIFKSAVVQTTVTAIAAASFFVYTDYKDKQMSSENLMRYVIHSEEDIAILSMKVVDELSRIDKGISFSNVISGTDG